MNIWQIIAIVETCILSVIIIGCMIVARLLKQDEREVKVYNGKSN